MPTLQFFLAISLISTLASASFVVANRQPQTPQANQAPRLFIKNYTSERRNFLLFHSNPKKLLQRRPQAKPVQRKAQGVPQAATGNNQLDSLIQTALANTGSNTTIVIINKTPTLVPKLESILTQAQNQAANDPACKHPNNVPGANGTVRGYMTLDDIAGLVNITRAVGELYDGYYKIFPDKSEVLSDKQGSSIIDNTAQVLSFYGKVKRFVVAILDEKNTIQKDIETIRLRVNTLQTSEMDMLRFLGLDKRYQQVKLRTAAYEGFDPKFGSYYMDMVDMTMNFQINVQSVLRTVADLDSFTRMFLSAVNELSNIGINKYNNEFLNILDKIDTVLMFLATLVQLKVELEAGVKNLIGSLKTLGSERQVLSKTLDNLQNLAEFYEVKGNSANSILTVKGASRVQVFLCALAPLVWLIK